jgi:AraC-like DNA-binding protein
MESTLIIGIFMSLLLPVLLLSKKRRGDADIHLAIYLILSAIGLTLAWLEILNRERGYPNPFLINTSAPFVLLLGPALWLYVKRLITPGFKASAIHLLMFLPFTLAFFMLLFNSYIQPDSVKIAADSSESFRGNITFPLIMGLIAVSNIGYTLWGLLLIKRHRVNIKSYYSKTEKIDLQWLKFLLIWAFICYTSISLLYIADSIRDFMPYSTLQLTGYNIASVFVIILGFFGLRQGNLFSEGNPAGSLKPNADAVKTTPKVVSSQNKTDEEFALKLITKMKEQKPHLNPDLNLGMLSKELGVSADYLSGIINGLLEMNFYDFINHYRVEEFKQMCRESSKRKLTIIALAYDCGFNSKATFNRVFKKNTGITPGEYFNSPVS